MNRLLLPLLVSSCLITDNLPNDETNMKGHIIKSVHDNSIYIEGLSIIIKRDNQVIGSSHIDKRGDFELTLNNKDNKGLEVYCEGVGLDTLYIGSIINYGHKIDNLSFLVPIKTRKNILGQAICPKCKRSNKVYKVRYGDASPVLRKISSNGDTTYTSIYKGYYNAGTCINGGARYFCERDKIKF